MSTCHCFVVTGNVTDVRSMYFLQCLPKHISVLPSLFSPAVLVRYPKISSYPAESLTFRALALLRVVHVIDCVIPFLCSTSPNVDLVTKPKTERPYPLVSFKESSFSSPVSQDVHVRHTDVHPDKEGTFMKYYLYHYYLPEIFPGVNILHSPTNLSVTNYCFRKS